MKSHTVTNPVYGSLSKLSKRTKKSVNDYIIDASNKKLELFYFLEGIHDLQVGELYKDEENCIRLKKEKIIANWLDNGKREPRDNIRPVNNGYVQIHHYDLERLVSKSSIELKYIIYHRYINVDGELAVKFRHIGFIYSLDRLHLDPNRNLPWHSGYSLARKLFITHLFLILARKQQKRRLFLIPPLPKLIVCFTQKHNKRQKNNQFEHPHSFLLRELPEEENSLVVNAG